VIARIALGKDDVVATIFDDPPGVARRFKEDLGVECGLPSAVGIPVFR
jgi:hypothetical protein